MNNTLITFFPLGNADTTLIQLASGQNILFDFADMKCNDDSADMRCELSDEINRRVPEDFLDVVCFSHADEDHIKRFSEYFYLEHAGLYQTTGRKKINELWVPAAVLLETGVTDDQRILRSEARYRLKQKKGIKVFSRPKKLREWCDGQDDISYHEICHLIVDAGETIPEFSLDVNGIEIFVHSPFLSESQGINRNNEAIVIHATFNDACQTKLILGSDINSDTWSDIVEVTRYFENDKRLNWDLFHISHHCSYTALSNDKGINKVEPNDEVKWLFETQGNDKCRIVSPSWTIDSADTIQPPHFQAANYYKEITNSKRGEFFVTMDYPKQGEPKPLTFEIDRNRCMSLKVGEQVNTEFVYIKKAERAGYND
jgi:hypothetical protein